MVFVLFFACAPDDIYRPIEIEIYGVSARAAAVSLKVFALEKASTCSVLKQDNIVQQEAYLTKSWARKSDAERSWVVPKVLDETITLVVYSTDDQNQAIQFVCRRMTYEEIGERETGVLIITLDQRADL